MENTKFVQKPLARYGGITIWEDAIYGDEDYLILKKDGKFVVQDEWEVSDYIRDIDNGLFD